MAFVLSKGAFALLLVIAIVSRVSFGDVYNVGDAAGWSLPAAPGGINAWANSIDFQIGDIVSFEYNPTFHNVLKVSREDYESCNTISPTKVYATGRDLITLESAGPHYFICGAPNHCQMGMKLEISIGSKSQTNPIINSPPNNAMSPFSFWPDPWMEYSAGGQLLATKLVIGAVAFLAYFAFGFHDWEDDMYV